MDEALRAIDQPLFRRIYREFPWVFKEFIRREIVSTDPFLPFRVRYAMAVEGLRLKGYLEVGLPLVSSTTQSLPVPSSDDTPEPRRRIRVGVENERRATENVWAELLRQRCSFVFNISVLESGVSEECGEEGSVVDPPDEDETDDAEDEFMDCEEDEEDDEEKIDWEKVEEEALIMASSPPINEQFRKRQIKREENTIFSQILPSEFPHVVEREEVVCSSEIANMKEGDSSMTSNEESEKAVRGSEIPEEGSESEESAYALSTMLSDMELVRFQISKIRNFGKRVDEPDRLLGVEPRRSATRGRRFRNNAKERRRDGGGDGFFFN